MVEAPGMYERLGTLRPHEVEALHWSLYARKLEPIVTTDVEGLQQQLADEEKSPSSATLARRRGERRERLTQLQIGQAAVRELLLLDREDLD